jgi:hypothetical protein
MSGRRAERPGYLRRMRAYESHSRAASATAITTKTILTITSA